MCFATKCGRCNLYHPEEWHTFSYRRGYLLMQNGLAKHYGFPLTHRARKAARRAA